jgi:hypothetical protein
VLYTDARAPARGALLNDIIDMMPQFFKDVATVSDRERERVLNIAKEMSTQDKEDAFGQMPENLRGGATDFDQWLKQVRNGQHDDQLGIIHGHLHATAGDATAKSGQTPGRALAEEGTRLVNSGTDLVAKAYGKVPGVGKAIDLTKKAREWDAYLQKVYADPLGTLEASARKTAEEALADRIKKDLTNSRRIWARALSTSSQSSLRRASWPQSPGSRHRPLQLRLSEVTRNGSRRSSRRSPTNCWRTVRVGSIRQSSRMTCVSA